MDQYSPCIWQTGGPELDPRTHVKNKTETETNQTKPAGVVACICNRRAGEMEATGSLDTVGKFQANERPFSKHKVDGT